MLIDLSINKTRNSIEIQVGEIFKFRCPLAHKFKTTMTLLKLAEQLECPKCKAIYERLSEFAEKKGGKILNKKLEKDIVFKCKNGHEWSASYGI